MSTHSLFQNGIVLLSALAGTGGISAFLTYRTKRREIEEAGTQNMANVAKTLTDTAVALLEPVRAAATEAERKVASLQERVRDLEHAMEALSASLAAATAASAADRAELTRQLEQMTAERDRLAGILSLTNSSQQPGTAVA